MESLKKANVHPMVVFWLGVITGALILSLIFLERMLNLMDYQAALIKISPKTTPKIEQQITPQAELYTQPKSGLEKLTPEAYGVAPIPTP